MANGTYTSPVKGVMENLPGTMQGAAESFIIAQMQAQPLTNLVTNYLSGGLSGGIINGREANEIIFDGHGRPVACRKYSDSAGEKPITNTGELQFDQQGNIVSFTSGKLTRISQDALFKQFGGEAALTGGVYPDEMGDVRQYQHYIEEREFASDAALEMDLDYYKEIKQPLSGTDPFGRSYYVARIPHTESPLKLLDPGEYDLKLANRHLGTGLTYKTLDLIFKPTKEFLVKIAERTGGAKIVLDPFLQMQLASSRQIGGGLDDLAVPLYAAALVARPLTKYGEDGVVGLVGDIANGLVDTAYGVLDHNPPAQQASARRIYQVPGNYDFAAHIMDHAPEISANGTGRGHLRVFQGGGRTADKRKTVTTSNINTGSLFGFQDELYKEAVNF